MFDLRTGVGGKRVFFKLVLINFFFHSVSHMGEKNNFLLKIVFFSTWFLSHMGEKKELFEKRLF